MAEIESLAHETRHVVEFARFRRRARAHLTLQSGILLRAVHLAEPDHIMLQRPNAWTYVLATNSKHQVSIWCDTLRFRSGFFKSDQ